MLNFPGGVSQQISHLTAFSSVKKLKNLLWNKFLVDHVIMLSYFQTQFFLHGLWFISLMQAIGVSP